MDWRDEAWQHIDKIAAEVASDVTRDFLRPALNAAGFAPQDVERYEVTYVQENVKPCRPIYCARHYGNVVDAECVGAYQCLES